MNRTVKYVITSRTPRLLQKKLFFLSNIRMSEKNVNFGDKKKNKKSNFYKNKNITKIDDFDVNKILVSKEELFGTKNSFRYFIGYNDKDVIRPLSRKLP